MREIHSTHDDLEKRLAVFFGLGAFILSSLLGLARGFSLDGILLRGVVALILATLGGWLFGFWLRSALTASTPAEELPPNVERRSLDPSALAEGSVVIPNHPGEGVVSEETHEPLTGTVVNYTLPELDPADLSALLSGAGPGVGAETTPVAAPK